MARGTATIMTMPVVVDIVDPTASEADVIAAFNAFRAVDEQFSPFREQSEVSRYGRGGIAEADLSSDLAEVLRKAQVTKEETEGYFDIYPSGRFDPSGLVKGWAIQRVADMLRSRGFQNFYLEVGGDIQVAGHNQDDQPWSIGIRHPFQPGAMVKVLRLSNRGVATSGTYERGRHIFNPHTHQPADDRIVSLTVIGPNVYEADRFATAAFAMGPTGINFIQRQPGLEGYLIDRSGQATMTTGFDDFTR